MTLYPKTLLEKTGTTRWTHNIHISFFPDHTSTTVYYSCILPGTTRLFRSLAYLVGGSLFWKDLKTESSFGYSTINNEAREARSLFVFRFPRKKKPLDNGSCEACRVVFYFLCMFVSLSVSVNIVISHLGRPHSTHTAPMPSPMGSVHAQNNEAFSCGSCCKSFRADRARRGNVCF